MKKKYLLLFIFVLYYLCLSAVEYENYSWLDNYSGNNFEDIMYFNETYIGNYNDVARWEDYQTQILFGSDIGDGFDSISDTEAETEFESAVSTWRNELLKNIESPF